ncbi:hypothetical protein D3C77_684500 [compost metagenome]
MRDVTKFYYIENFFIFLWPFGCDMIKSFAVTVRSKFVQEVPGSGTDLRVVRLQICIIDFMVN